MCTAPRCRLASGLCSALVVPRGLRYTGASADIASGPADVQEKNRRPTQRLAADASQLQWDPRSESKRRLDYRQRDSLNWTILAF